LGACAAISLQCEARLTGAAIATGGVDTIVGTQLTRELGTLVYVFSCMAQRWGNVKFNVVSTTVQ